MGVGAEVDAIDIRQLGETQCAGKPPHPERRGNCQGPGETCQGETAPARNNGQDNQGPDQVELLFNCERPQVLEHLVPLKLCEVGDFVRNEVPVRHQEQRSQGIGCERLQGLLPEPLTRERSAAENREHRWK